MKKVLILIHALLFFAWSEDLSYNRYFLVDRIFLIPFVLKYSEDLGISEEQLKSIKEFVKKNEREIERNRLILRYLERKAKIMILEGRDEKEIREVLTDIASVKMEMSLLNARSVRFLKEVLTPEQFGKLKDIIVIRLFELQQ